MKKTKLLGFSIYFIIIFILLILSSIFLYLNALNKQDEDGKLINTSGRQRMLSQKITKNCFSLVYEEDKEETKKILRKDVTEFAHNFVFLVNSTSSDSIRNRLFLLKQYVTDIKKDVFIILNSEEVKNEVVVLNRISKYENIFLEKMNDTVALYESQLRKKQMNLKGSILLFSIIMILIIVSLVVFIQIPLIKKNAVKTAMLEEKNKDLEDFVYIASHDLQEPLGTIKSFISIVEKKYAVHFDDKGKQALLFIKESSSRMQNLIKSLLDLSRLGIAKKRIKVNCNELLKILLNDIQLSIKSSGAIVTFVNLPTVNAHEVELRLLFQNLILNAIKYRKESSPEIHVSAVRVSSFWEFTVKDNGKGIAKKNHEKIFKLFQQLHARKEYSGVGVGLAHARKIVELHGGRIWVESEEGIGSLFKFTITIN